MFVRQHSSPEHIQRARSSHAEPDSPAGVELHTFVSGACGAAGLSTGIARFQAGVALAFHLHNFSEAITVLEGQALVTIGEHVHMLDPLECIHVPADIPHRVQNAREDAPLVAHWAFASATPSRTLLAKADTGAASAPLTAPKSVAPEAVYELSPGAFFRDGFAAHLGSRGICGGHGRFLSGASLPCHTHDYDESITIVRGRAICRVQDREYELSGCDTAFIPRGVPHRFLNHAAEEMHMIWVYGGDEPSRTLAEGSLCSGKSSDGGGL